MISVSLWNVCRFCYCFRFSPGGAPRAGRNFAQAAVPLHKHVLCVALRFHGFDLATRHLLQITKLYAEIDPDLEWLHLVYNLSALNVIWQQNAETYHHSRGSTGTYYKGWSLFSKVLAEGAQLAYLQNSYCQRCELLLTEHETYLEVRVVYWSPNCSNTHTHIHT